MRVAALDLGSNTSLLLIADVENQMLKRVLFDDTTITRMGQGVHANRRFHPEAMARVDACLGEYAKEIKKNGCEKVVAVATSAARDVQNGPELVEIGRRHGIPIYIITGDREARLTFKGAACDRANTAGIGVVDVGGGSTEVISQNGNDIFGVSVDVGSVRLSELFVHSDPILPSEQNEMGKYIVNAFAQAKLPSSEIREIVAVAGTPTTLAALEQKIEFSEEKIHGYKLSLQQIDSWISRLSKMTLDQRQALPGMQPKRADVIVAGTMILAGAIRALKKTEITVSTRGVRYGVALQWQDF